MQVMQPWIARRGGGHLTMALARILRCRVGLICLAVAAGGCSSINTPLPDIAPTASTSMSAKDQKKAVEELNKKRDTHEQDAEREIENSR
jgi:hypothetical protein